MNKIIRLYCKESNRALIAIIILFVCNDVCGQEVLVEAALPVNLEWSEGSIMTNDGKELRGLLKYNDKSGLVAYENGSDKKSFTARNVAGFEFFDEETERQRIFYSLPYEDPQNNVERPLFFEVIKEFAVFAVLSKVDPIDIDHKSIPTSAAFDPYTSTFVRGTHYGTTTEISQTETIYLMDPQGNIRPYIKIVEKEIDGIFYDTSKTKNKMLDDDLLEEFIGPANNKKLVAYAKENDLSFKRKSDLIKILDYYSELIK